MFQKSTISQFIIGISQNDSLMFLKGNYINRETRWKNRVVRFLISQRKTSFNLTNIREMHNPKFSCCQTCGYS